MKYNTFSFFTYKASTLLPTLLLLLFVMNFPSVICTVVNHYCNNSSTFTKGSTYSTNLNLVINDLFNASGSSGFNTSSHGQSPNKVYGLLQCTGDISAVRCSNCVLEANNSIQQLCTNGIGGEIWLDDCFLRYQNSNFISVLDTNAVLVWNLNNITGNRDAFESTTSGLLSNLSDKAYIPANKGFAAGSANYSASGMVYGLVQCWRDISIQDCRTCLVAGRTSLNGSADQGAQFLSGSCKVRYEIFSFFDSPSPFPEGSAPPTTSTPSVPPTKKKSSKTLPIVLGIVGGIILALLFCLIASRKKFKFAIFQRPKTIATHNPERHRSSSESGLFMQEQQFVFSIEVLAEATENFHDNNKLGEGGFGVVYKGTTRDGNEIAVKKLFAKSAQGKNEFMNEVKLVANIQHRNLTKLLGCCVEGDERFLVYEYLPNKSLDMFLFDSERSRELDWKKRYNIIIGIARGLLYLHEDSQLRIIHRDIKANNILLDHKLSPKIADFGLARLFPEDKTYIHTGVAGTYGYMAPEYAMQGQLSVKVDVYSFGVVMLEIITGRKNIDRNLPYQMQSLVEWAWKLFKGGNGLSMVDSKALEVTQEQALRCIQVGLLCVQVDATLRPTISNVIIMLSSSLVALPNPSEPPFVSSKRNASKLELKSQSSSDVEEYEKGTTSEITLGMTTSSSQGFPSINETSITKTEAR